MKTKIAFYILTFAFLSTSLVLAIPNPVPEKVSFNTSNGVKIVGQFFKPASFQKMTFVLLHGLGSSKEEWFPFAQFLSSKGFGVFIYDMRGHNESNKKISGENVNYQLFYGGGLNSDWGKMINDLGFAIQLLKEKYKVDPKTVGVGGASIGANIAFRYATEHKEVPLAILLSPGIDYQGIKTDDAIKNFGRRPLLMAASLGDRYAYQSVLDLQFTNNTLKLNGALLSVLIESLSAGHGVQMFRREKSDKPSALEEKIFKWIQMQKT